ncbi:MAG TPA: hypothetical protein VHF89_04860 [Solirubrobacteraceae bacterium]|nr:hypothetical protein [Solirubrobacteraceae bacterium]
MSRAAVVETGTARGPVRAPEFDADAAPAAPRSRTADVAAALASRIPAEAIAVYTGVLAFLVKDDEPLNEQGYGKVWALAAVVAVLAVMYGVGVYRQKLKAANKPFKFPVWRAVNILIAFAAWVCVIPGSPLQEFDWYSPDVGAIIAIVTNAFLGALALFIDDDAPTNPATA